MLLGLRTYLKVAGVEGFEPSNGGFRVLCLTAWLHPNVVIKPNNFSIFPHKINYYSKRAGSVPFRDPAGTMLVAVLAL